MRTSRNLVRAGLVTILAAVSSLTWGAPAGAGPTAAAAPAITPPLSVQGNRIVDASGRTVVLRGLNRAGTEVPGATPVPSAEIGWMGFQQPGSWHANVVRVLLGSAQWTGACPQLADAPDTYRAQVDAEVQGLTAQGIVAILDLHTSTAGCASIARHAMPDAPVSKQFWADVATRYRSNPLVAFELYNEPHYVTDLVWLQGTTDATVQDCDDSATYTGTQQERTQATLMLSRCRAVAPAYRAAGMQELYDIVMTRAPGHLVLVDGQGWASLPSSKPLREWAGNVVHALHPYTCPTPGAACNTTSNAVANLQVLDRWLSTASSEPVLVTEMGWPVYPKGDGTSYVDGARYYRETLAYLQRQSPPWGFLAFAFDGGWKGSFSLIKDTTTYAPNSTGQPVYDLLRAA